jgi:hypothetical protein
VTEEAMAAIAIKDAHELIKAIDEHLADDARQLAAVQTQADSVHAAYADLMTRLRLEIEAASGGARGAHHLRG